MLGVNDAWRCGIHFSECKLLLAIRDVSLFTGLGHFTNTILLCFCYLVTFISRPSICNSLASLAFCIMHPYENPKWSVPAIIRLRNPIPMPVMHGHRLSVWLSAFVSGQNRDANAESRNIEGCLWSRDLDEDGTIARCVSIAGFDLVGSPVRLTLNMSEMWRFYILLFARHYFIKSVLVWLESLSSSLRSETQRRTFDGTWDKRTALGTDHERLLTIEWYGKALRRDLFSARGSAYEVPCIQKWNENCNGLGFTLVRRRTASNHKGSPFNSHQKWQCNGNCRCNWMLKCNEGHMQHATWGQKKEKRWWKPKQKQKSQEKSQSKWQRPGNWANWCLAALLPERGGYVMHIGRQTRVECILHDSKPAARSDPIPMVFGRSNCILINPSIGLLWVGWWSGDEL